MVLLQVVRFAGCGNWTSSSARLSARSLLERPCTATHWIVDGSVADGVEREDVPELGSEVFVLVADTLSRVGSLLDI